MGIDPAWMPAIIAGVVSLVLQGVGIGVNVSLALSTAKKERARRFEERRLQLIEEFSALHVSIQKAYGIRGEHRIEQHLGHLIDVYNSLDLYFPNSARERNAYIVSYFELDWATGLGDQNGPEHMQEATKKTNELLVAGQNLRERLKAELLGHRFRRASKRSKAQNWLPLSVSDARPGVPLSSLGIDEAALMKDRPTEYRGGDRAEGDKGKAGAEKTAPEGVRRRRAQDQAAERGVNDDGGTEE